MKKNYSNPLKELIDMGKLRRIGKIENIRARFVEGENIRNRCEEGENSFMYHRRKFAISNFYTEHEKELLICGSEYAYYNNCITNINRSQYIGGAYSRSSSSGDSGYSTVGTPPSESDSYMSSDQGIEGWPMYNGKVSPNLEESRKQIELKEQFQKIVVAALQDRQKYKDLVAISKNLEKLANPAKDICENFRRQVTDFNEGILHASKALAKSETNLEELDKIQKELTENSLHICQLRARFRTEVLPTMNMNWVREQTGEDGLGVSGLGFGGEECTENIDALIFADIKYVVDLREAKEVKNDIQTHHKALEKAGITVKHLPTPDNTKNVPFDTLKKGAKFVNEQRGHGVINCKGGSNRSGEMTTFILLQQELRDTIKNISLKEIKPAVINIIDRIKKERRLFAGQPLAMVKNMQQWQEEVQKGLD